jgi:DNA-binding GntR family transcriptional regulator
MHAIQRTQATGMNSETLHRTADSIAPRALYIEVADRLRRLIQSHAMAPGDWIDEQALATQYGISRTPLREALKVLATEGMVVLKPRRGCYVAQISGGDLEEIYPIMALLEGECAAVAARNASDTDLADLAALHRQLEECAAARDVEGFFDANQRFHLRIHEIAGNRRMAQMIDELRAVLKLQRHDSLYLEGRLIASLEEHRMLLAALNARDADTARSTMQLHIESSRRALGG